MIKTHSTKPSDISRQWYLIDAKDATLGRLASKIARLLLAKDKPNFTPHLDMADNIVVINAAQVKVTGNKLADKKYYRHSGYPGGLKETTLEELLKKDPSEVIRKAVCGMLPSNKLRDDRMSHLRVFAVAEHTHAGQNPKPLEVK